MKAFVDWLLARRWRPILVAGATMPLVPIVSAALVALETVRAGVGPTLPLAALGGAMFVLLWTVVGPQLGLDPLLMSVYGGVAVAVFAVGVGLGALLRWAGRLVLAFEAVLVVGTGAVLLANLFGPGGSELLAPVFDRLLEALESDQEMTQAQLDAFRQAEPLVLGLLAAGFTTTLVLSLFLAYWLCAIAVGEPRFGAEFRALRLSRVIGIPATILVTVGLVLQAPVVQNLTALALVGFLFQGLSVMHAWAHARSWHAGYLAPVYVLLLLTPLRGYVVLALAAAGLMDNWFDLRAPLRPRR
ncbi:MAG TPA: hypothetical protein VF339_13655 [Gammaproteobacteria bacterium]